jgi:predicted dithiol-disulfide oxidoreductase (DUF899 family)
MALPEIVSRQEWRTARVALLEREKQLTRARDALNADRRRLPMVAVEKDYVLTGPDGEVGLIDLFDGCRQLLVQHVMFDPEWDDACPSCTAGVDEIAPGVLSHLRSRDTAFALVARAPVDKIERYRAARGWAIPWYSSFGSDFNYDFGVTIDASVRPVTFNYRTWPELEATGMAWLGEGSHEQPAVSAFLRDGDPVDGGTVDGSTVFHTYSTYARGTDTLAGAYDLLDITALGRQEEWEEPKGRVEHARAAVPSFDA